MTRKTNVLFLFPGPIYNPDLPNFKDRFEMLSENFEGEIYTWTCNAEFNNGSYGAFTWITALHRSGFPYIPNRVNRRLCYSHCSPNLVINKNKIYS